MLATCRRAATTAETILTAMTRMSMDEAWPWQRKSWPRGWLPSKVNAGRGGSGRGLGDGGPVGVPSLCPQRRLPPRRGSAAVVWRLGLSLHALQRREAQPTPARPSLVSYDDPYALAMRSRRALATCHCATTTAEAIPTEMTRVSADEARATATEVVAARMAAVEGQCWPLRLGSWP